jgi:hypothetical protein
MNDPVSLINQDRGVEYKSKMRSTEMEIKTIEHEKGMLEEEISRGGLNFNEEEDKKRDEDFGKLNQELYDIMSSQKEEKLKLYQLEKEDIILMEKIKFFQDREVHVGSKRQRLSQKDKDKIEQEMKQLISDINDIIEERNKTETEKKTQAKHLAADVTSV